MREASGALRNPFVELMNEIHRVLQPGGRLLAITPAFPHPAAFTDPTHVNIITEQTHTYFTGSEPGASIYGFRGRFTLLQARRETPANAYDQQEPALRKLLRRSHRRLMPGGLSHMLWEFEAA